MPRRLEPADPDADETAATLFDGSDATSSVHRATAWARTSLGPVQRWSHELRAAVRTMLPSQLPMMIWWGPDLIQLYNDAFAPMLGEKHPAAVGQPAATCWAEVWDELGPMADRARSGRTAFELELPLLVHRRGYDEETFWTVSMSPIRGDGGVQGVFVAAVDETRAVVRGRRLQVLGEIGALSTAHAGTLDEVLRQTCASLARHTGKVAFAVARAERSRRGPLAVVAHFGVDDVDEDAFPGDPAFLDVAVSDCTTEEEERPEKGWPVPPTSFGGDVVRALHLPIIDREEDRAVAVLTVGINPHRALDDDYRTFLNLLARQVSITATDALALDREHERTAQLTALDQAKNRFLQNVSHELRTPLTLIAGSHRSLVVHEELSEQARRDFAVAERATQRLRRLVDGLLALARSDEGVLAPQVAPTDLGQLTGDVAGMFRSAIERAGIELRVDLADVPTPVLVDPEMWTQILSNLISNAYKFTEHGAIDVALGFDDDEIRLVVSDTGVGMDEEDASRAFERFHRATAASPRTAEGAGIGLSLVHDLTAAHGGRVSVESEPGRGCTFTVQLPLRPAGDDTTVLADGDLAQAEGLAAEASAWPNGSEPTATNPAHDVHAASTVLVVEDNADLRAHLTRLLEDDGWSVIAVEDVPSALAIRTVPALVLSDIMLPGSDGIELTRALRAEPATAEVPIVLLTAKAGPEAAAEGIEAGATDFLTKPFDADELLARVRSHADLHHRRRAALDVAGSRIRGLESALASSRRIGMAVGIAMALHGLTTEEAFDVLSRASQNQNRKLRDVAEDVVFTGTVPR